MEPGTQSRKDSSIRLPASAQVPFNVVMKPAVLALPSEKLGVVLRGVSGARPGLPTSQAAGLRLQLISSHRPACGIFALLDEYLHLP